MNTLLAIAEPRFSPDGQWIAFSAVSEEFPWAFASRLFVIRALGGVPIPLACTPDEGVNFSGSPLGWSTDSYWVLGVEADGTVQRLFALPIDRGPPRFFELGRWAFSDVGRIQRSRLLGVVAENLHTPPEAYIIDLDTQSMDPVSQLNQGLRDVDVGHTEVIRWHSIDGRQLLPLNPSDYRVSLQLA